MFCVANEELLLKVTENNNDNINKDCCRFQQTHDHVSSLVELQHYIIFVFFFCKTQQTLLFLTLLFYVCYSYSAVHGNAYNL